LSLSSYDESIESVYLLPEIFCKCELKKYLLLKQNKRINYFLKGNLGKLISSIALTFVEK